MDTKKILIANRDDEFVGRLTWALENVGMEVFHTSDGNTALAYIEVHKPDLIIMGIMLHSRNGILVLEKLRLLSKPPCPIMIVTVIKGNQHREYVQNVLGVASYDVMPVNPVRLMEQINELVA